MKEHQPKERCGQCYAYKCRWCHASEVRKNPSSKACPLFKPALRSK